MNNSQIELRIDTAPDQVVRHALKQAYDYASDIADCLDHEEDIADVVRHLGKVYMDIIEESLGNCARDSHARRVKLERRIRNATEGQLRVALYKVIRTVGAWHLLLDEGMDDESYANGLDEATDSVIEQIEKALPRSPSKTTRLLDALQCHAVVRDGKGRLWEKVGRKTGLWVPCRGRPTYATGEALASRAPITVVKR